jgi:hypothetical protein
MSQALYPPSNPQSIGQALDTTFRIFQATLAKCLPHGVLSMIAGQLPNIYFLATGKPMSRFGGGDLLWWVLYALGTLASLLLWSAMLLRQYKIVTRQPTRMSAELIEALRRMPALIGLGILGTLAIAVGLIALVVPGLYLTIGLLPAWPAVMLERRGPSSAIRYGLHLIKGHWWRSSALLTVAFIVAMVFYFAVFALLAMVLPLVGANDVAMFTAASVVVVIVLGAVGVPFYGAVILALYGDLKLRKEGTDLEIKLRERAA